MLFSLIVGGGTPAYEAMLERKRAALRRALKMEYIKKMYNPKSYNKEGYVEMHDAALMRFHAMQKTVPEFWVPNIRGFVFWQCMIFVPLGIHFYLHHTGRIDFEKKCRTAEYAYDDPERATRWWATV